MRRMLNNKVLLAINILDYLRGQDEAVTCARIAEEMASPPAFTYQVLVRLRRKGYVESYNGPGGGYARTAFADRRNAAQLAEDLGSKAFLACPRGAAGSVYQELVDTLTECYV